MLSLLFLITLLVAIPSRAHNEEAYKNGYYPGRSADIVVDDEALPPVEIQLEWQITKTHQHESENVQEIQDVHIYNLVSRALGLPQIQLPKAYSMKSKMDDSVPFDFFQPLNGNVLFSVEGLSSDAIPSSTVALGASPVYTVAQTSRPYNPLSMLTTLITGTQPRKHGIVNHRDLTSMTSNLFDVAKGLYPEAEIVAGSTGKCFATILSVHRDANSYYWDSETSSFVRFGGEQPTVLVNKDNINEHLSLLGANRLISFQTGFEAKIGDVAFDVNDEADTALFSEVAFVAAWSSHLARSNSKKFLSFHFKSLAAITSKYGKSSPQWLAAIELIDASVLHATTVLRDCVFEIVYLPSCHSERTKEMQSVVSPLTSELAQEDSFPAIYLNSVGKSQQEELCQKTKRALSHNFPETTVFCPLNRGEDKKRAVQDEMPLLPLSTTVLQFHYVLWTMLVIIVALVWSCCLIAYIPPDESLYTAATYYKKGIGKY